MKIPNHLFINPTPAITHLVLKPTDIKAKTIIVGDIHGCLVEFRELLQKCEYNPSDSTLILVGDLVNKGPYSAETVKYARSLEGIYCVRGNHDETALSHALKTNMAAERPEYYDYVDNLTKEDIQWMQDLPYSISIPSLNTLIVHAGLVPGVSLADQEFIDLVTIRNVIQTEDEDYSGFTATSRSDEGCSWADIYDQEGKKALEKGLEGKSWPHVYFGHDAKRKLQLFDHATGLDTGCVYGESLSAMILPSRKLVQVKAKAMYSEPNM